LTSATLTRVFFRDLWRGSPSFRQVAPQQARALLDGAPGPPVATDGGELDAVLLIGDAALLVPPRAGWEVVDLGTEWTRWTGLPCIYAFWVWRGGPSPAGLVEIFERAKDIGLARIDDIVASLQLGGDFDSVSCRHYLNRVIQYDLGHLQLEGLLEFYRRLQGLPELSRHGLGREPVNLGSLRWLDAPDLAPA
jgi:chorismate dehydratase